jgi:hypothetical protein
VTDIAIPVLTIAKTKGQELRISFDEFNGSRFVSIRTFVFNRATGNMVPTKSGVTFKPDLIEQLLVTLQQMAERIKATGINNV